MFGMAAAASALDLINSLTKPQGASKTKSQTGFDIGTQTQSSTSPTVSTSSGQGSLIAPDTMNALFAAQNGNGTSASSRSDALASLFSTLDADGSGQISKGEFESALGAGGTNTANADKVFGKLDTDGDGNVSMAELAAALKPKKKAHGPQSNPQDALLQALNGANASTNTNSDGSKTSTITYADGSTVTMTTPTNASASSSAARSYNAATQMIQQQVDRLTKTASASSSLSVSV